MIDPKTRSSVREKASESHCFNCHVCDFRRYRDRLDHPVTGISLRVVKTQHGQLRSPMGDTRAAAFIDFFQ